MFGRTFLAFKCPVSTGKRGLDRRLCTVLFRPALYRIFFRHIRSPYCCPTSAAADQPKRVGSFLVCLSSYPLLSQMSFVQHSDTNAYESRNTGGLLPSLALLLHTFGLDRSSDFSLSAFTQGKTRRVHDTLRVFYN